MEYSITKQLVAQISDSVLSRGASDWEVVISKGTMLKRWRGRQIVSDGYLAVTRTGRVIRPFKGYYVVRLQDRQVLVKRSDAMLVMTHPFTKTRLSDKMDQVLIHDYIHQKRLLAPYVYERLTNEQAVRVADQALEGKWYIPAARQALEVEDVGGFDWAVTIHEAKNNSFRLQLHYLTVVNQLTRAYGVTNEEAYLDYALTVVLRWTAKHPVSMQQHNQDAYHEHGTAIRVFHLIGFIEAFRQSSRWHDHEVTGRLLKVVYDHAVLLSTADFYRPRHNHGLFQDMALFAIASHFPEFDRSEEWERIARARFEDQLASCLSEDGTHLEHSPGYHVYVYRTLTGFSEWAHINGFELPEQFERIHQMPGRLLHLVKPNRTLPMLGDTGGQIRGLDLIPDMASHPDLAYAVSGGQYGVCPTERMMNLGSQYAVMREYWQHPKRPMRDATHLVMTAGYHGSAHKHADDLSLELYGLGRDFIVETGRYGYADCSERAQALRVAAHNTVHRLGDELDLAVEFVGESGILSVEEAGKAMVATGMSRLIGKGAVHTRTIAYDQARTLVVYDQVKSPEADLFVQRFHLAPDLRLVRGSCEEQDVRFGDDSGRTIQIVQLFREEESYMSIEESHISIRDFQWIPRRQVASIEYGEEIRYLTLIRLDRTGKAVVDTQVKRLSDCYEVSYWLEGGTRHRICVPLNE